MSRWYTLNELDEPVEEPDIIKASRWLENNLEQRQIAYTKFGECFLSTVFLGLDHNYRCGTPILFESLWFGGPMDGDMRRYHTKQEALEGHEEMLKESYSKAWEIGLNSILGESDGKNSNS